MEEGLYITINSDDPPMFNTTLTNEFIQLQKQFGWDAGLIKHLTMNALHASLLSAEQKHVMVETFETEFKKLHAQFQA
jgi:adenosine deaminase